MHPLKIIIIPNHVSRLNSLPQPNTEVIKRVKNTGSARAIGYASEISATVTLLFLAFLTMLVKKDKETFISLAKSYHPYIAGIFAAGAYLLVLIAMSQVTNVSFVQAFRQLSLPLSAFLGWYLLKEKITYIRWIALIMIMAGLIICVIK